MSAKTIYAQLISAGMSPTGACAMLGNFQAESALRANNVQDGFGYTDRAYTEGVDAGAIDFLDNIGYGLYQLTYGPRKRGYLAYARSKGKSVGDEATQVEYAIIELKNDYSSLWRYLCSTTDLYTATSRVCKEFERPAVNNIDERYKYAQQFASNYINGQANDRIEPENEQIEPAETYWPPRTLAKGMKGADVVALQGVLTARGYSIAVDGDLGAKTHDAIVKFQKSSSLEPDGICGSKTWTALLKR